MMNYERVLYKTAIGGLLPDPEDIRRNALSRPQAAAPGKKKGRWLIVAAACLVAIAVTCAAVPPVRAAITQWFERNFSVQNYVATSPEVRPSTSDLDSLIEKTKPEKAEAANSIEIANMITDWRDWAAKLKPTVGDVFFDGKQLIVSFDMGGGAPQLIMGGASRQYPVEVSMGNPGYIKLNGEKYAYSVSARPAESTMEAYRPYMKEDGSLTTEGQRKLEAATSAAFTATVDFSRTVNVVKGIEEWPKEHRDALLEDIKKMQAFDPEYTPLEFKTAPKKLEGMQQAEINLPIRMTDTSKPSKVDKTGIYFQSQVIGLLKLKFSFDPAAGNENMHSYAINQTVTFKGKGTFAWADWDSDPNYVTCTNKTIDMTGVKMTAKRMDVYASGAELYVSITCPDTWDALDKKCFLGSLTPQTKGDGVTLETSGEQYGLEEKGEDLGMCIHLNILPSEIRDIDTFEIIPVISRYTGYDEVPYTEGKPTRIKKDEVDGWQETSTELGACALKFSLK